MKKNHTKILCFILSFLMTMSCINFGMFNNSKVLAEEESVKVKVRIEGNKSTIVKEKEIDVDNFDLKVYGAKENPCNVVVIQAIIKALELQGIDTRDKTKFDCNNTNYISNIAGLKERSVGSNDGWMYYINHKFAKDYANKAEIKDGDSIVVFFQEDYEKSIYTRFDKEFLKVKAFQDISLKLLGTKKNVDTDKEENIDISGAKILVNNKELTTSGKYITTESNGNVTFRFNEEGTYIVSAVRSDGKNIDITRPYCKVVVEKGENVVNKDLLKNVIDEGKNLFENCIIGTKPGQYSKETKDLLKSAIDKAEDIYEEENVKQSQINSAKTNLEVSILNFKKSINKQEELGKIIEEVLSFYNRDAWKNNNYKKSDYITSMALRRAGVNTDFLSRKVTIYNYNNISNDGRNVMNIIGIGENPRKYNDKDYTKKLPDYDYEKEDKSENIAKDIIAMDMAKIFYDEEKVIGAFLSKAYDQKDGKIAFGTYIPESYDDWLGEYEPAEYMPDCEGTAWALIALSRHKNVKNSKDIIEKCKKYLKSCQVENKEKNGLIENNSVSTALTIQALIALGENPRDDYWCINNDSKKISLVDGLLSCKKDNQFMTNPNSNSPVELATSHALAALVDLNTMKSMYKELKPIKEGNPIKIQINGKNQVYEGGSCDLSAKAFDYHNIVVENSAILWKSLNEDIVKVSNGKVMGIKKGEANIVAYIKGNESVKDSIKIEVATPPKIDKTKEIKNEIEFLKKHYLVSKGYEFLASPAAVWAGMNIEDVKSNIHKYSSTNMTGYNVKTIIALFGAKLNPKDYKGVNYIEMLEKSQVKDGENKGKFIKNKYTDENCIETQAYSIMALDLAKGKYNKEDAVKALLTMINDPKYKEKDHSYKNVKTEGIVATVLARHKNISGVEAKIKELIEFFKEHQNEDGAFDMKAGSTWVNSPVATSCVVQALLENGIDPLSWKWTKNGNTMLDGMMKSRFQGRDDSTSGYNQGQGLNFENVEASYYAFSALVQMLNKKSIFDFIDENYNGAAKPNVPKEEINKDYIKLINDYTNKIVSKNLFENNQWYAVELNKIGKNIPDTWVEEFKNELKDCNCPKDLAKNILGIVAAKKDPTNLDGINILDKMCKTDMGNSLSDAVFGLIALDSVNFNVLKESKWQRNDVIKYILSKQKDDGGWTFVGSSMDPDSTAMVLSSLAPYYKTNEQVKKAIDKALDTLSKVQKPSGVFESMGKENSNSISMLVVGLSALNIDVTKDTRFIKNGHNLLDVLMNFKTDNETFGYEDNKEYNELATEQALRAFVAYKSFKEGKGSVYEMEYVQNKPKSKEFEIKNITGSKEFKLGEDAKVTIQAKNISEENRNVILIVGLFDNNGKLLKYVGANEKIEKGKMVNLIGSLKLPKTGEFKIKAFVWDSLENMKPLSDVIKIDVK